MLRRGQALVVVLLVLAVAMTLGVSIASRSVTEQNIATLEDESSRALDAAEAGVEVALGNISTASGPTPVGGSSSTYEFSSSTTGSGDHVSPPDVIKAGDSVSVFLAAHDASGNLILDGTGGYNKTQVHMCWGNADVTADEMQWPALGVTLHYYDSAASDYGMVVKTYDPNGDRRGNNGFANPGNSGSLPCTDRTYPFWVRAASLTSGLGMPSGAVPLYLKLRMFYNGSSGHFASVWASGAGTQNFPNQGKSIISLGREGQTARKLSVFQRYYELPPIFEGALFSGTSLNKP